MKKASLVLAAMIALTGVAQAYQIVQNFDTGQISPGANTLSAFTVNKFNTALGTLTKVTFTMSLDTWGGSYNVVNTTTMTEANPQGVTVNGTMHQGVSALISGSRVPDGMVTTLSAGQDKSYTLLATGNSYGVSGPTHAFRNSAGPTTQDALAENFGL